MVTATDNTTKWTVPAQNITISGAGDTTGSKITLATAGKYVDRDIELEAPRVSVADGAITAAAPEVTNGSASIAASGFTAAKSDTGIAVTLTTTAGSAKSNAGVSTAGWVETTDTAQSAASNVEVDGDGSTIYIPTTSITKTSLGYGEEVTVGVGYLKTATKITNNTAAGTVEAADVTVTPTVGSVANGDGSYPITGSAEVAVTSATAGYISDTVGTLTSGSATISGTVAGSTLSKTEVTPGEAQTVEIGAGYYPTKRTVTVKAMSEGAKSSIGTATSDPGAGYTENKAAIVPSGGYLTISAGYIPATKISLATLVPDGTGDKPAANAHMLAGYKAYDKDGKLLTGTIAERTADDVTVSGKTVSIAAGYYADAQSKSVATAIPTIGGTAMSAATGTADTTSSDVTITVPVGYNETARTITASASAAALSATGTASATVSALTVGAVNTSNNTVAITGEANISGEATAATTTTGRATAGTTKATGSITGKATVSATLPCFDGTYTVA